MNIMRIICLLFLFIPLCSASQDSLKVIGLHPSVGKSISHDDKLRYDLFPEYNDSLFSSASIILNTDSSYTLSVTALNKKTIKRPITRQEMDELYRKIEHKAPAEATDYVQKESEKKAIRKERATHTFMNVLGQIVLISLQVMLTAAFIQ
jgi:hypothetical protein